MFRVFPCVLLAHVSNVWKRNILYDGKLTGVPSALQSGGSYLPLCTSVL